MKIVVGMYGKASREGFKNQLNVLLKTHNPDIIILVETRLGQIELRILFNN